GYQTTRTSLPPPLFPYTTLFRSDPRHAPQVLLDLRGVDLEAAGDDHLLDAVHELDEAVVVHHDDVAGAQPGAAVDLDEHLRALRSEEHTSELQSRENLVCRLLLE